MELPTVPTISGAVDIEALKDGQRSPFLCHLVTWHNTNGASYIVVSIGEVNNAITFEQTAFSTIHESESL